MCGKSPECAWKCRSTVNVQCPITTFHTIVPTIFLRCAERSLWYESLSRLCGLYLSAHKLMFVFNLLCRARQRHVLVTSKNGCHVSHFQLRHSVEMVLLQSPAYPCA